MSYVKLKTIVKRIAWCRHT